MRRFSLPIFVLTAALFASPTFAAITYSGTNSPSSGWGSSTTGYVGSTANGSISVTPTSTLQCSSAYIGGQTSSYPSVTGNVTLNGSGTTGPTAAP